jgi:hypothetical protein
MTVWNGWHSVLYAQWVTRVTRDRSFADYCCCCTCAVGDVQWVDCFDYLQETKQLVQISIIMYQETRQVLKIDQNRRTLLRVIEACYRLIAIGH